MSSSRRERMLMLRARIAVERAEMVLALGDLRQAATLGGFAGGLARGVMGGLWAGARGWVGGGADGGPGATALLRMLRRG
ncbi:MAG: hypothetical protein KGL18_09960, partial [Burkholderiales bacterium]|nr:hypothetical protein [Burkholderiales bacterium]